MEIEITVTEEEFDALRQCVLLTNMIVNGVRPVANAIPKFKNIYERLYDSGKAAFAKQVDGRDFDELWPIEDKELDKYMADFEHKVIQIKTE